ELGGERRVQHGESARGNNRCGGQRLRQGDGQSEAAWHTALFQHDRGQPGRIFIADRNAQRARAEPGGKDGYGGREHDLLRTGAVAAREGLRAAQPGFAAAHFGCWSREHGNTRLGRESWKFVHGRSRIRNRYGQWRCDATFARERWRYVSWG